MSERSQEFQLRLWNQRLSSGDLLVVETGVYDAVFQGFVTEVSVHHFLYEGVTLGEILGELGVNEDEAFNDFEDCLFVIQLLLSSLEIEELLPKLLIEDKRRTVQFFQQRLSSVPARCVEDILRRLEEQGKIRNALKEVSAGRNVGLDDVLQKGKGLLLHEDVLSFVVLHQKQKGDQKSMVFLLIEGGYELVSVLILGELVIVHQGHH